MTGGMSPLCVECRSQHEWTRLKLKILFRIQLNIK